MTAILSDIVSLFSTPIGHDKKNKAENTKIQFNFFSFFFSLFLPLIYLHTMKSNMKHSRVRTDKPPTEQFVCWGWNEIHQNVSIKQNTERTAPLENSQSQNFINFMNDGE